ncbi:MAG: hypothetical protein HZA54_06480 [Planctomycetes bacterium]|nr:hypothetical protein [Planctomycetota bacterium]
MAWLTVSGRRAAAVAFVGSALAGLAFVTVPTLSGQAGGAWGFGRKVAPPTPEVARLEGVDLLPGSRVAGFFALLVNGSEAKFARAVIRGTPKETIAAFQKRVALLAGVRELKATAGAGPNVASLSQPVSSDYGFNLALLRAQDPVERLAVSTSNGPFEAMTWLDGQNRRVVVQASPAGDASTLYLMAVYRNPNVLFGASTGPMDNPGNDLADVPRPIFARRTLSLAGVQGAAFGLALYQGRGEPGAVSDYYAVEMPKLGWKATPCPPELAPLLAGEEGRTYVRHDGAMCVLSFARGAQGEVNTVATLMGARPR